MAASSTTGARAPTVQRSLLRHQVVDLVREQLTTGSLAPGQHLLEKNLADALETSRGPVREALLQLEAEGLIVSDPHRGFTVIDPDLPYVIELYEYRAMLEGFAAERAACRSTPELMDSLRRLVDKMEAAAAKGDVHRMLDHDLKFHETIVVGAEHERVLRSWMQVKAQVELVAHLTSSAIYRDLQDPRALHEPILKALEEGDEETARAEASRHVTRVPDLVEQRMGPEWESSTEHG